MVGTFFSIILAALLWMDPHTYEAQLGMATRVILLASSFLFLLLVPFGYMFAWAPLQKAEQDSTPRILEMFQKDKYVHLSSGWAIAFALTTLVLASDLLYPSLSQRWWFFPIWIILLGITWDIAGIYFKRVFHYANPFSVIKIFAKHATLSIEHDRELDLCDAIEALAEIAMKGIQRHSTSLCHAALQEQQKAARLFLGASKSIAHVSQDAQTQAVGIQDKVSYTLFYLYQRLDIVFDKALKNHLEPTCNLIVTIFGKLSVDAAKYDMSLASIPLRHIGICGKQAQTHQLEETATTATCVYLGVAKTIINEIDLAYYEIQDAFLSIINGMETLAKGTFAKDKTTNIALLVQPFKDLRALFESDKMKNHQDTPVLLKNIDRVLGEYEELQVIMNTMPPIPKFDDQIESSQTGR